MSTDAKRDAASIEGGRPSTHRDLQATDWLFACEGGEMGDEKNNWSVGAGLCVHGSGGVCVCVECVWSVDGKGLFGGGGIVSGVGGARCRW